MNQPSAVSSQPQLSVEEEVAARAAYEAFAEEMAPWFPYPANWPDQADMVKRAWSASAKAVQQLGARS